MRPRATLSATGPHGDHGGLPARRKRGANHSRAGSTTASDAPDSSNRCPAPSTTARRFSQRNSARAARFSASTSASRPTTTGGVGARTARSAHRLRTRCRARVPLRKQPVGRLRQPLRQERDVEHLLAIPNLFGPQQVEGQRAEHALALQRLNDETTTRAGAAAAAGVREHHHAGARPCQGEAAPEPVRRDRHLDRPCPVHRRRAAALDHDAGGAARGHRPWADDGSARSGRARNRRIWDRGARARSRSVGRQRRAGQGPRMGWRPRAWRHRRLRGGRSACGGVHACRS